MKVLCGFKTDRRGFQSMTKNRFGVWLWYGVWLGNTFIGVLRYRKRSEGEQA